ncbi:uncharacterized protein [Periplaneta americana]|uniref:uncharacterized protein n=1 Tax=Periplaneta americana TaxID=6978 RepID=UPI0037E87697
MVDSTLRDADRDALPVLQRIQAPLIWARLTTGIRIEDLQEKRFEEAIHLLKKYFIREETLCRASELADDPVSVESFIEVVLIWMRDMISLAAIEEGTGKLVGLVLNRVNGLLDHTRSFSRIRMMKGEAFNNVMELRCFMHKNFDVFEHYNVDQFFRFYGICVKRSFRDKGVGMGLLKASLNLARLMGQTVAMGIFTCVQSQQMAEKLGMVMHYEIEYSQWIKNDDLVFDDPGAGNYSAMLMAMRIPDVPPTNFVTEELQEAAKKRITPQVKEAWSETLLQKETHSAVPHQESSVKSQSQQGSKT